MKLTLDNVVDAIINLILVFGVYRMSMHTLSWYVSQVGEENTDSKYKTRMVFILLFVIFAVSIVKVKDLVLSYFVGI